MDPEPFLAAHDKAVLAQVRQVPGDRGLGQAQRLVQVADAHLSRLSASRFSSRSRTGSANALKSRAESSNDAVEAVFVFIRLTKYSVSAAASQSPGGWVTPPGERSKNFLASSTLPKMSQYSSICIMVRYFSTSLLGRARTASPPR